MYGIVLGDQRLSQLVLTHKLVIVFKDNILVYYMTKDKLVRCFIIN